MECLETSILTIQAGGEWSVWKENTKGQIDWADWVPGSTSWSSTELQFSESEKKEVVAVTDHGGSVWVALRNGVLLEFDPQGTVINRHRVNVDIRKMVARGGKFVTLSHAGVARIWMKES
jgi:streptogramin lyase